MKTSNKILTFLAITLLTVPLIVFIVVAKINRIDNKTYNEMLMGSETSNIDIDRFVKKYPVQAFQNVTINGPQSLYINVKVIVSDKFLLKATTDLTPYLACQVDKDGRLNISISGEQDYLHGTLMIFSPKLEGITFKNVSVDELSANTDSLNVQIDRGTNFRFGESTKIKNLSLIKKTEYQQQDVVVPGITIENAKIENLLVDINAAYLTVNNTALRSINLKMKDAKVEFKNEENTNIGPIETLTLNSTGSNNVNFQHIKINVANGNLSDETTIQLPTVNLKQIIK